MAMGVRAVHPHAAHPSRRCPACQLAGRGADTFPSGSAPPPAPPGGSGLLGDVHRRQHWSPQRPRLHPGPRRRENRTPAQAAASSARSSSKDIAVTLASGKRSSPPYTTSCRCGRRGIRLTAGAGPWMPSPARENDFHRDRLDGRHRSGPADCGRAAGCDESRPG